jgi:hypothetical protein
VGEVLEDLAKVLAGSCAAGTEEDMVEAREVIERVTGGRIMVYQAGLPEAHHGWLKASFQARILVLGAERCGVVLAPDHGPTVEVEFRRLPVHEQIAEEVKKLWDDGLTYGQIAQRVKWNRNIVAEAVAYWHTSRGLPAPDGRHHIGRLKRAPRLAEQIAD